MATEATNPDGSARKRTDQLARRVYEQDSTPPKSGSLNPDWVEWLMGVPSGWTSLYVMPTEHYGWPNEPPIPRVTTGAADRVDRIRLLGNGVVPQTAAEAWLHLDAELRGVDVPPGERLYDKETGRNCQYGLTQQVQWTTPNTMDYMAVRSPEAMRKMIGPGGQREGRSRPSNLREQVDIETMKIFIRDPES